MFRQLDPARILASLNGEHDFGAERKSARRVQFIAKSMDRPGRFSPAALAALKSTPKAPDTEYVRAADVFRAQLRELVDEWIESGYDENGVQTPKDRDLEKTPKAAQTLFAWIGRSPIPAEIDDPVADAKSAATRMFRAITMDSKMYYRISRCTQCGRYFFWERPKSCYKPRKDASRAVFYCPACRSSAGPPDRMQTRRDKLDEKWLSAAADALTKWRSSEVLKRKFPSAVHYIAERMQRYDRKQTWVTRNLNKIEERADLKPKGE